MKISTLSHRIAVLCAVWTHIGCAAALIVSSLAAQTGPRLTPITQIQATSITVGAEVSGPRNSMVMLAVSIYAPLKSPIHTPFGGLYLRSTDAVIPLYTNALGKAVLKVPLVRPVAPFSLSMQALVFDSMGQGGRLTNLGAFAAGGTPVKAATASYSVDGNGNPQLDVTADGKPRDEVLLFFYDDEGKVIPPATKNTIGASGSITFSSPIPAGATRFEVKVGGVSCASGTLPK